MENTIISVKDITARYEKKTVLEKVSLEVKDKDYLGIIGPNGGGKTTLIRIILGMLQPAEGKVEYYSEGNKVNSITMGYLPQYNDIDHHFPISVYDVVLSGLDKQKKLFHRFTKEQHQQVEKTLADMEILDLKDSFIGTLSGGQLQRVLLARTIAQETPIILLDEPTNHLDFKFHTELLDYLKKWSTGETEVGGITHKNTVISVFHDIGAAALIADSILLMKDGAIIKEGSTQDVLTRNLLEEIYDTDIVSYYSKIYESLPL